MSQPKMTPSEALQVAVNVFKARIIRKQHQAQVKEVKLLEEVLAVLRQAVEEHPLFHNPRNVEWVELAIAQARDGTTENAWGELKSDLRQLRRMVNEAIQNRAELEAERDALKAENERGLKTLKLANDHLGEVAEQLVKQNQSLREQVKAARELITATETWHRHTNKATCYCRFCGAARVLLAKLAPA